ncbi:aminocarboxymuconate-semialdehyde decarboxylase [Cadophora sp. DSE1049]|nr:aminocarboxymuconate-semialdehyde decarboxylase [Cadophora sp. DSE1049]
MAEEKIDVHAHIVPPFYREACLKTGHGNPDGMPGVPEWNEEAHLELMRTTNISKTIVSISSPGVHLSATTDTEFNKQLCQNCNDFASDLVRRHPTKFGFWATLPLPDVEAGLAEITRVIDGMNAVGFVMETNNHGVYLGDPSLDSVFKELNRVKAKVFIHPTTPCFQHMNSAGEHAHKSVTFLPQYPNPMMEFMFDTTRALINLFASGTIARCPDITFVIPHAGGALPPILQRCCAISTTLLKTGLDMSLQVVKKTFREQFYFDLAGFPFPDQIHGLLRIAGPERLLYGSDWPFTPSAAVDGLAKPMSVGLKDIFEDDGVREGIYLGNAKRLIDQKNRL